jgi:hypothetical protein
MGRARRGVNSLVVSIRPPAGKQELRVEESFSPGCTVCVEVETWLEEADGIP